MIEGYKRALSPAIWDEKASGLERNPCSICGKKFKKGDSKVEFVEGAFKGTLNYNRLCKKCFLVVFAFNFPEIFDMESDIKKQLVLESLK